MRGNGSRGDIIAEGRNKVVDGNLREAFRKFYDQGPEHIPAERIQQTIDCKVLKVLPRKSDCIGLQMADLLARPSFLACKYLYFERSGLNEVTRQIARVVYKQKFYRRRNGKPGYGCVWRPMKTPL